MRTGLGVKLSLIIGLLVATSLSCVTLLASHFVGEDVRITAQSNNLALTSRSSFLVTDRLSAIKSGAIGLLDTIASYNALNDAVQMDNSREEQTTASFFVRNNDIASIIITDETLRPSLSNGKIGRVRMINSSFLNSYEIDEDAIDLCMASEASNIIAASSGEERAVNASKYFGFPAMMLLFPWQGKQGAPLGDEREACILLLSTSYLTEMLGMQAVNETFMTNAAGDLLSAGDTQRLIAGENMADGRYSALFERSLKDTTSGMARQELFVTRGDSYSERQEMTVKTRDNRFYGAWQKIDIADIMIFTVVPLDKVTEAVDKTRRNNFYLTGVIMFLSMFFILLYVRGGITQPLRELTIAADEIQRGNFDTDIISRLNTTRRDEIGLLNLSTQKEQEFLGTFARFTNKAVAKSIAAGTLDFQPHLKDLTVFFSDIRGFTSISDGFNNKFGNNSPKEIISFLNDYMARMVNCVTLSGGNIDKFEGDAIMGVWGIMRDDNLDFVTQSQAKLIAEHHEHVVEDAINCIRGVLAMRYALMEYNKEAEKYTREHLDGTGSYKPHIRIGCGINTGRATAGLMGSEYKMEYTAIGDAVNFASRTESANKPCGTDILITEDTYTLLKKDYIRCKENGYIIEEKALPLEIVVEMIPVSFSVKGKGTQHFYGVVNMPQFDIEAFFRQGDSSFTLDEDCAKALGPSGPRTLNEVRRLLGIPMPDFAKVDLNTEENKISVGTEGSQNRMQNNQGQTAAGKVKRTINKGQVA